VNDSVTIDSPNTSGLMKPIKCANSEPATDAYTAATTKAASITRKERAVPQKDSIFSEGKHISRAPIWSGRK